MRKRTSPASRAILLACVVGSSAACHKRPEKTNPFVGTWVADLTKSTFPPMPGLKGVTQHIAVMFDTLTLGSEVDMGDGPPQVTTELFHLDGKEHFGTLNPGTVLVATQINPRRIEIRGRQDGREFPTSVYEVSPDGKTLTIKQATGMEVVGVYNRSE